MPAPLVRPPRALVRDAAGDGWLAFDEVRATVETRVTAEVRGVVAAAEQATDEGGWAVGFVAYEAAPGFDAALVTHPPGDAPLAWFALCEPPRRLRSSELPAPGTYTRGELTPTVDAAQHAAGVEAIRRRIAYGDTYQVNFTHHLVASFAGDPWGLFLDLWRSQRAPYACWIDCGRLAVCSVSPELFFELEGERVTSRPMKGTAPRGRTTAEDLERSAALRASRKDRAENVMIVDMIRNDLGRVARPGSVRTTSLLDVERYESVFQLTSTVSAETDAGAAQVLSALFPCASITGAPKVRTTEIIRGLESRPRGIYTGTVGWMAPERRARLAVAIRTAIVDRREGELAYGTGGGIVWDSDPDAELRESRDKARLLLDPRPEFELLETMLFEPDSGYVLLDRHLTRLADSAAYFGFRFQRAEVARRLRDAADGWAERRRARLTLGRRGTLDLTSSPMAPPPGPWRVALAAAPVDAGDPFLYHKTTHRQVYETRLAGGDHDDVLLWNEAGELTESTVANLVLELDGRSWTPPLRCGLLPGTRRAELLDRGEVHERVLTADDLRRADRIRLVNSVRGWIPVHLEEENGWDAVIAAARRGPGRPPR